MNICADCQNPINTCSWEREFKPVEGWIADETAVFVQGKRTKSYKVNDCPLFTPPPGYTKKQVGIAKPVIARDIRTGEETIYPSTKKASVGLGVTEKTVTKCISYGGILYGKQLRYARKGE